MPLNPHELAPDQAVGGLGAVVTVGLGNQVSVLDRGIAAEVVGIIAVLELGHAVAQAQHAVGRVEALCDLADITAEGAAALLGGVGPLSERAGRACHPQSPADRH